MLKRATWTAKLLGLLLLSQLAYGADQDAEVVVEPQAAPVQEVQASEQEVEASAIPPDTSPQMAQVDAAEEAVPPEAPPAQLDVQMEDVKKALSKLKRDLVILEEDLLFPASSQVAVFLSMDVGKFFNLDAVTLKVNGKQVTHHLYTQKQVDALARGGVQKLYVGNVKQGDNRVTAFFTGTGPNGRDFRRATTVDFEKGFEPTFIELAINDATEDYQPDFSADIVN